MSTPAQEPEPTASAEPPSAQAVVPPVQPEDPRKALLAQRDRIQETFVRLIEEERYDEAVTIAGEIVDLTKRAFGEKSLELAKPLTNLATAQMRRGDFAEAEMNYNASIAIIEATEGPGSKRLSNPLIGLGETCIRTGSYEQAKAAYRWALQVNHAAAGFYNLEQVEILDGLSESYLGLDKLSQANAQQRIQVAIHEHRSGPQSPAVVPALYKLGRWYNRTGQYVEARDVYQHAQHLIRVSKGGKSPALVDAFLGEAVTYENEGAILDSAKTMKRALNLLDSQPEADHRKRAEVLVALGDLFTLSRQSGAAQRRYAQAWHELSGEAGLVEERDRYFAQPSPISRPPLPTVVGPDGHQLPAYSRTAALASGFVLASFTVDADGETHDMKIVESDPPGLIDKQVQRALRSTAFRPRMADAATIATEDVHFRHEFLYLQPVTESPASPAHEPAGEKGEPINYPDTPPE